MTTKTQAGKIVFVGSCCFTLISQWKFTDVSSIFSCYSRISNTNFISTPAFRHNINHSTVYYFTLDAAHCQFGSRTIMKSGFLELPETIQCS